MAATATIKPTVELDELLGCPLVEISYVDTKNRTSRRVIEPQSVLEGGALVAFCHKAGERRHFRPERISDPRAVDGERRTKLPARRFNASQTRTDFPFSTAGLSTLPLPPLADDLFITCFEVELIGIAHIERLRSEFEAAAARSCNGYVRYELDFDRRPGSWRMVGWVADRYSPLHSWVEGELADWETLYRPVKSTKVVFTPELDDNAAPF